MLGGEDEGFREEEEEEEKSGERKVYARKSIKGVKNNGRISGNSGYDAGSDNFSGMNGDKCGFLRQEDSVRISLSRRSKSESIELRRELEKERDLVRSLMSKIEANEEEMNGFAFEKKKKEKRTPKANKLYRNSEFLLEKDKFPAPESNKKSKPNGKKGEGSEKGLNFDAEKKLSKQMMRNCNVLLERLMKHKHGWVFNKPVDAAGLGLLDYFQIIKTPMDLGTVKTRLNQGFYKSLTEFAEDVRLTFRNALTYNPKEQDVYLMADQLSKIFEEKWRLIEADYMRELKLDLDFDVGSSKPASNKSENIRKPSNIGRIGAASKKPKAKDLNKREMSYDEKQKLSINLQSLPSEKLENVVHIIKKRNPSVSQEEDEIEVDIDSVDTETLWELDRFITNYKKSLSKNKRQSEMSSHIKGDTDRNSHEKITASVETGKSRDSRKDEMKVSELSAPKNEHGGSDTNRGASNSNSSSGSSSSDSDGESSSGHGSDRQSPKK